MELTRKEIREIIDEEIEVDCYEDYEIDSGWEVFMTDNLESPFEADYFIKKKSGKRECRRVKVVNKLKNSNLGRKAYYVEIELEDFIIPVKLDNLTNIQANEMTLRAIEVWQHRSQE